MKYLKIFTDFMDVAGPLSDEARGRLFGAMLRYAEDGAEPAFKGKVAVAWAVAKQHIDRERAAYEEKVKHLKRGNVPVTRKKDPVSGEDNEKEKYNNNDKEKDKDSLFSSGAAAPEKRENRPTLEEVVQFAQEADLQVDVEYFYTYYEANGWHIGKLPIRNWKAALKAWARNTHIQPKPAKEKLTDRELFQQAIELHRMKEAKEI